MDITQYKGEHIYRFPVPTQTPPMWISLAGITRGDDCRKTAEGASAYTVIEYVFSGTGALQTGGDVYYPTEGDLCIVPEKAAYTAETDPCAPWTKMVIHLKGTAAASFVQAFGLDKRILYKNCGQVQGFFEELFETIKSDEPIELIMEQGSMLLMKLLTAVCSNEMQNRTVSDEVQVVKRFIENNYQRNLTMDDISAAVFRSNDYVQKQFKQVYGVTPYSYYMELKMECAKNLLQQTNLSIGQIAEKLGYKSDRYFSARFRRVTGMTATQFRKQK